MSNKGFLNTVFDAFGTLLFIHYGIPLIIIILVIMLIYQGIYGFNKRKEYESMDNIIVTSKLESTVYDFVKEVYDINSFSSVAKETTDFHSVEIKYVFKEPNKDAKYYDELVKNEVSKLYNKLKGNVIASDQIFATDGEKDIALCFYYPMSKENKSYLCTTTLMYYTDKGFDEETYQNIINLTIVTSKQLNYAKEHMY